MLWVLFGAYAADMPFHATVSHGHGLPRITIARIALSSALARWLPFHTVPQVLDKSGNVVPHVYCIGDANGKYMLAHAASAQGISAVENMCARPHVLNHLSIPAACFTHPEVSFVGVTQEKAEEMAKEAGFPLGVVKTSFKANSKVGPGPPAPRSLTSPPTNCRIV